jgi:DNA-binding transcriptional MerR regulator
MSPPVHRGIGQLAARLGVTPPVLRMWEQRYGVVTPARTDGGLRRYSAEDEERLRQMVALVRDGVPAGQAARSVLAQAADAFIAAREGPALTAYRRQLSDGCRALDEALLHDAIDCLLGAFDVRTVLAQAILPQLRELGAETASGGEAVAVEHFATTVLRARLLGLARGWDRGVGPRALLACPSGELHDVGLIAFGLALRQHGWRIVFLGADTPRAALAAAAARLEVHLVVISAVAPPHVARLLRGLHLPPGVPLALGGAAAARRGRATVTRLPDDVLHAADAVARDHATYAPFSAAPRRGSRP